MYGMENMHNKEMVKDSKQKYLQHFMDTINDGSCTNVYLLCLCGSNKRVINYCCDSITLSGKIVYSMITIKSRLSCRFTYEFRCACPMSRSFAGADSKRRRCRNPFFCPKYCSSAERFICPTHTQFSSFKYIHKTYRMSTHINTILYSIRLDPKSCCH